MNYLLVSLIPEYIKKEGVSLSKKPVKTGFTGLAYKYLYIDFKVQCQSFAGMITQDSERSFFVS